MFIRALLTTLLILLPAHTSLAGTRDPNTPDSKYVEFGQQFPSVVRYRALGEVTDKDTGKTRPALQYGSAVIIRPHWVLTAAHVVEGAMVHAVLRDNDDVYILNDVIVPKEFTGNNIGFYDLALCYSPKDFALDFYPALYKKPDELGKPITIAGYGLTGTFHTGCTLSDGKKRAGHNAVEGTERGVLVCKPNAGPNRFPLEYMIAPGDSGGGMFIGNELAGINSFLMASDKNPDGTYGDESAFTRVSLYANWVESQIEKYELALAARATTSRNLNFEVVPFPSQPDDKQESIFAK
jgi:hypothetical protein